MVCVASLMSLIRSFESFEVELVLGTPFRFSVYSTKIYSLIHQTPVNYAGATALSMLILNCDPAVGHLAALGQSPPAVHHAHRAVTSRHCSRWESGAGRSPGAVFMVASLATIIPLIFLLTGSVMNLYRPFRNRAGLVAAPLGRGVRRSRLLKALEKYFDAGLFHDGVARLSHIV